MKKRVLILMGRGKSTLTDFFKELVEGAPIPVIYDRVSEKKSREIKEGVEEGFQFVIHIQGEKALKAIPLSIRKRALIFKIDF